MSLNGLDAPNVNEAYQAALAEAGGWLLLKYIARDAVDLLNAGTGGVTEVREAVEQYDEKSPLYGFVQYRRRKVLLKFIPEGTSRLLQARVSVQFQSVVERFAPHDAVISIANPSDLKETALSSACSLHTASASVRSSNGSLRGRGLAEIAEVVGEQQDSTTAREPYVDAYDHHPNENRSSTKTSAATGNREPTLSTEVQPQGHRVVLAITPTEESNIDKALPATPALSDLDATGSKSNELVHDAKPGVEMPGAVRLSVDRPSMDRPSVDRASSDKFTTDRASMDRGQLSQSARSSTLDVHNTYRPKVKLGPRPSVDSSGRQRASGSHSRPTEPRPVSSLPPGVCMPARKPLSAKSPSQQSSMAVQRSDFPKTSQSPSQVQVVPAYPTDQSYPSPENANGYLRHAHTHTSKAPAMTPEKQRLMKALQLRKQQMAKQEGSKNLRMQASLPSSEYGMTYVPPSDAQDIRVMPYDVVAIEPSNNARDSAIEDVIPANNSVLKASHQCLCEGPSTAVASFIQEQEKLVKVDKHDAPEQTKSPPHASDLPVDGMQNTSSSSAQPLTCHESVDDRREQFSSVRTDSDRLHNSLAQEGPLPPATESEESKLSLQRVILKETQERAHISHDIDPDSFHAESHSDAIGKAQSGRDNFKTRPSTAEYTDLRSIERSAWRRGLVDPIRVISSADDSDELTFLSDDSFMEELKSATLQEAKPISVSKTPITPLFPRRLSDQRTNGVSVVSRTVSSPLGDGNAQKWQHFPPELPIRGEVRSVSASPSSELGSQHASAPMAKKVNVSSGISQRIKALEMFTSRENSPVAQSQSAATSPVGSVISLLNTSLITTPPHKYDSVKSNGLTKRVDTAHISPSASPEAVIPDHKGRLNGITVTAKKSKPRPESISVTARIVRDSRDATSPLPIDSSGPAAMDLFQSPLVVDHQVKEWFQDQSRGRTAKNDRPSSIHSSSLESRRDSITSGRSLSSRKDGRPDGPRSMSDESSNGLASPDEQQEVKTRSRKSRLFKRMSSSFSSASRRSIVQALSPTVKEQPISEHHKPVARVLPNIIDVGDVNVQFPDTLLWKRRCMRLDDRGNLIMSPSKADNNIRSVTKQYHISDFRFPYVPDQDQQELPYSVILDFNDGSTLQCACENLAGQKRVLDYLKEAHRAYPSSYGS